VTPNRDSFSRAAQALRSEARGVNPCENRIASDTPKPALRSEDCAARLNEESAIETLIATIFCSTFGTIGLMPLAVAHDRTVGSFCGESRKRFGESAGLRRIGLCPQETDRIPTVMSLSNLGHVELALLCGRLSVPDYVPPQSTPTVLTVQSRHASLYC